MWSGHLELHRAAWVAPISSPPISNGAVLVNGGSIVACGHYKDLKASCAAGTAEIDHGAAAVIPALVNAHTHLELTALEGIIPLPQDSFSSWLKELLPRRFVMTPEVQRKGAQAGMNRLLDAGTAFCGDITNGAYLSGSPDGSYPGRHLFLESIGFNCEGVEDALGSDLLGSFELLASRQQEVSLAAHSCYSASGSLIRAAKKWCRENGRIFSIHAAEHREEVELLESGTGYCRELLDSLGRWTPGWAPPAASPVSYLDSLGVLDKRTLLVHAVHMSETDWETAAKRACKVCFCPRSNYCCGAGRADIGKALRRGITACLGTDSLASNTDLSLFAEAAYVLRGYPDISPAAVLRMLTMGGALALEQNALYGSIEPGRRAALLAVSVPTKVASKDLEETIIYQGAKGEWQWVDHPRRNCA